MHDIYRQEEAPIRFQKVIKEEPKEEESPIRFSKVSKVELEEENKPTEASLKEDNKEDQLLSRSDEDWDYDADYDFDTESKVLLQEIRDRIDKLEQKGIDSYIIESLFKNRKQKLSRLRITKDYRIFLLDYFVLEIKMTPLPKAVFLLFLKHPEGIMFSYLPDFREELLNIYKEVKGPFYNESDARRSVWDVTDPLNNSINEKCSRIREAFIKEFDEHLARFYFVDGMRGEPKKIALPRNLVIRD
jgi:hypothetical protein